MVDVTNEELPGPGSAHLFNLFGAVENLASDPRKSNLLLGVGLGDILQAANYNVINESPSAGVDVAYMRTALSNAQDDAVIFTGAHGILYPLQDGAITHFALALDQAAATTSDGKPDTVKEMNDSVLYSELYPPNGQPPMVIPVTAAYMTALGVQTQWRYAITSAFVLKYMHFGENSVWYNAACSAYNTEFYEAAFTNGLSVYLGWDNEVPRLSANTAARFLFDRMAGTNLYTQYPATPPTRAFNWPGVLTVMDGHSPPLDHVTYSSPDLKNTLVSTQLHGAVNNKASSPNFGQFAPSIAVLTPGGSYNGAFTEKILAINGVFGSVPGSVMVGGQAATGVQWGAETITCDLPAPDQAGGAGDVVVTVNNHISNTVRLTAWQFNLHYSNTYPFSNGSASGSYTVSLTMQIWLRADIHKGRLSAADTPSAANHAVSDYSFPTKLAKITAFNISGAITYTDPLAPYTETSSPKGSPPYLLDGTDPNILKGGFSLLAAHVTTDGTALQFNLEASLPLYTTSFSDNNPQHGGGAAGFLFGNHPISGTITVPFDSTTGILAAGSTASADGGTLTWDAASPQADTAPDPRPQSKAAQRANHTRSDIPGNGKEKRVRFKFRAEGDAH